MDDTIFGLFESLRRMARARKINRMVQKDHRSHRRRPIDTILEYFVEGYHSALSTDLDRFVEQLNALPHEQRSVMYEGAFAALGAADLAGNTNWKLVNTLSELGKAEMPQIHYGLGAAFSHLCMPTALQNQIVQKSWGWAVTDSYGCHEGYFKWVESIGKQKIPDGLSAEALPAFDQGLGRAVWLIGVADVDLVASYMEKFPPHRRCHMWSGVGTMIGHWGIADEKDMMRFLRASGNARGYLQQGVATGAWIRCTANLIPDFTEGACQIICKATSREASELVAGHLNEYAINPADTRQFLKWQKHVVHSFEMN